MKKLKECRKCGKKLSLDYFFKNPGCKDGLNPNCRSCHIEMSSKNKHLQVSNCKVCGRKFKERGAGQRYCSPECRKKKNQKTRVCLYCGVEFKSTYSNKKYCGNKCRIRYNYESRINTKKNAPSRKECSVCGKIKAIDDFHVNRSSKDGYNTQCKACVGEWAAKYHINNYRPKPLVKGNCIVCDNIFLGRPHKRYCSTKCRDKNKKPTEYEIICDGCGKKAIVVSKHARFCNEACFSQNSTEWPSPKQAKFMFQRRIGSLKNVPDIVLDTYRAHVQLKREINK